VSYHLLNPFFGVMLSSFVLGTAVGPRDFLGAAIIALGLSFTTRRKHTPAPALH
jgi:drug/metabolite transporter (DMT)-like permease